MSFPRYPKYKDSGVEWLGEVPEHWVFTRIRFLLLNGFDGLKIGPFGSQLKSEILNDEGAYKVYGQENVINENFSCGDRYIDDGKFLELSVYEIKPGDLLITMMGTSGRCDVVPADIEQGIMDSHLLRIRVNNKVKAKFVRLLIDQAYYVATQVQLAGKGSIMQGLNSSIVKDLLLIVPPLPEQTLIAKFLDLETAKIDELVAEQKRLIELLKEKRQAVISHTVTKGLNPDAPMKPSGIEWLGEVPGHWEVKKLKYITNRIIDGTHFTPTYISDGIPFLRVTDIQTQSIDINQVNFIPKEEHLELIKRCKPEKGDILLSKNGTIGITKVIDWDWGFSIFVSLCLIKPQRDHLYPYFFCYQFSSEAVKQQIDDSTKQTSVINLHLEKIKELVVINPQLPEQEEIVGYLDQETAKIDELVSESERAIEILQERRTALISAAVTGQIDVRSWRDKDN